MSLTKIFDENQQRVLDLAASADGPAGYAAQSSRRHLERAWTLRDSMPELAIFSAITAEEEAAACIFQCLRSKKYPLAEKLSHRRHDQKCGLYPFVQFMKKVIVKKDLSAQFQLRFTGDDPQTQRLELFVVFKLDTGQYVELCPQPPFNLCAVGPDGKPVDYTSEVHEVASRDGVESVWTHIRARANERNLVLYASNTGIPHLSDIEHRLKVHSEAALTLMIIFLLLEPHSIQNLVQESIATYLRVLAKIRDYQSLEERE